MSTVTSCADACPTICRRHKTSSKANKHHQMHHQVPSVTSNSLEDIVHEEEARPCVDIEEPNFDGNQLDSLFLVTLNPDLPRMRNFHCSCGNDVSLKEHWCVITNDSTLVCRNCARCHCCSREACVISKRIVSIDGMVLCYRCVKFFGHVRRPRTRVRVEPLAMKDVGQDPDQVGDKDKGSSKSANATANLSNIEYREYNVSRTLTCGYNPVEDNRKLMRRRCYDPPVKELAPEDDPCIVPLAYLADDMGQPPMACPACSSIALGPKAYVVPSMARVYHRHCFRCCNCNETLAYGRKMAGLDFQYCSCEAPLVWCTKTACIAARHAHHKASKCRLGCLRPGGRIQADCTVEPGPEEDKEEHDDQQ